MPLLNAYKEALLPHGVEVNIIGSYYPKFFDGEDQKSTQSEEVKALLLGDSYVVGIGWSAERTEHGVDATKS